MKIQVVSTSGQTERIQCAVPSSVSVSALSHPHSQRWWTHLQRCISLSAYRRCAKQCIGQSACFRSSVDQNEHEVWRLFNVHSLLVGVLKSFVFEYRFIGWKKLIFQLSFLLNNVTIVVISKCVDCGYKPDSSLWRIFPMLIVRPVVPWATGVTWLWPPVSGQWFTVVVDKCELVPVTSWQRDHCLQILLTVAYVNEAYLFLRLLSRATSSAGRRHRKQLGESNYYQMALCKRNHVIIIFPSIREHYAHAGWALR